MSTTNSEALARLVALEEATKRERVALERLQSLTTEGYPFAALQAKITNRRTDVIAPVGAHAPVIKAISDFRRAKKLTPLQLVVVATGREAEETAAALHTLDPQAEILEFQSWETLPHERLSPNAETVGKRLKVLHRLHELATDDSKHAHDVYVIASIRAVLQPVVDGLSNHPPLTLEVGKDYFLPELSLKLVELAYERVDMVTKRGQFAVRGGIVDIFATTAEHAVRIEFFGDELEDIREFSVTDQRSILHEDKPAKIASIEIYAAREIIITPSVANKARQMMHEFPNIGAMMQMIAEGIPVDGMESLAPVLVDELVPFTEYLPKGSQITMLSPEKCAARATNLI
jgi:transcription-repair coupling factor (superfamily II helicase)